MSRRLLFVPEDEVGFLKVGLRRFFRPYLLQFHSTPTRLHQISIPGPVLSVSGPVRFETCPDPTLFSTLRRVSFCPERGRLTRTREGGPGRLYEVVHWTGCPWGRRSLCVPCPVRRTSRFTTDLTYVVPVVRNEEVR